MARRTLLVSAAAAAAGLSMMLGGAGVSATGNGSSTDTAHARGADAAGLVVIDFLPADGAPPLPADCWATPTIAIVSTNGNAVAHETDNKADDFWFTTTYTGDAAVYPVATPVRHDDNDNVVVDTSGAPLYTGHLTSWFGVEDNRSNNVWHATVSFQGVSPDGRGVSLHGHVQYASDAQGRPTAQVAEAGC